MCVCVCVCARARVCVCLCACVLRVYTRTRKRPGESYEAGAPPRQPLRPPASLRNRDASEIDEDDSEGHEESTNDGILVSMGVCRRWCVGVSEVCVSGCLSSDTRSTNDDILTFVATYLLQQLTRGGRRRHNPGHVADSPGCLLDEMCNAYLTYTHTPSRSITMCVCVCVYIHVCVYVCAYVYVQTRSHTHTTRHNHAHKRTHMHT